MGVGDQAMLDVGQVHLIQQHVHVGIRAEVQQQGTIDDGLRTGA